MKKIALIIVVITLLLIAGCSDNKKNLYLPEADNDKIYISVGGGKEIHHGEGYNLSVPAKSYRYEKDYDEVCLEEKWEHNSKDDVEIKVTTYKDSDEITARSIFLKDNEDYIFEDLLGYSLCGSTRDGDTLWFNLHESEGDVYIVSWEYPEDTSEELQRELADTAKTFELVR